MNLPLRVVVQNCKLSTSPVRFSKTSKWPSPTQPIAKDATGKSKMLQFGKLTNFGNIRISLMKLAFPQRLVIFHAGTARTAFLGMLKVFTVVIFGLLTVYEVPKHFYSEDQPTWVPAAGMDSFPQAKFASFT